MTAHRTRIGTGRPRLASRRHPMFEADESEGGALLLIAGIALGVLIAIGLAYGMAAQP